MKSSPAVLINAVSNLIFYSSSNFTFKSLHGDFSFQKADLGLEGVKIVD